MVVEPEHERDRAQLHDLGQDKSDGWGGLGMPDECRPSVLQGDGGDAVGVLEKSSNDGLHRVAKCATLIPSYPQGRV